ncbi:MAG: thioredoxin family protein [Sphingobacteriales bacterium]|nr:thioredoxin family protein [Sphingobacteriales bacterium]OJY89334.1 MAG: hypothetical protein BGP14_05365 [Sphingobacteriales bacterium 44-15]
MKLIVVTLLALIIGSNTFSQQRGIEFDQSQNWQAVLKKAKDEQKYIFVDCFATWCGPCKEMDKQVYASEKAGAYFSAQFISVKVQMDSTANDDVRQRGWYKDAKYLMSTYEVSAYPTYLFFSPEGKIVHKSTGFQDTDRFLITAADALNPDHQYYTLLEKYNHQQLTEESFIPLSIMAKQLGNINLSKELADQYVKTVSKQDLFTKDNIEALEILLQSSKDESFTFFLKNTDKINTVMDKTGYANGVVDRIIMKEEIDQRLFPNNYIPDNISPGRWDSIYRTISRKYNKDYADRLVTNKKAGWFRHKEQWEDYAREMVHFFDLTNGFDLDGFVLNNGAWQLFKHTGNKQYLNRAAYWMRQLIDKDPTDYAGMDTYANLLYRAGNVKEAIEWQQKAVELSKGEDKNLVEALEKMKKGEPTWP